MDNPHLHISLLRQYSIKATTYKERGESYTKIGICEDGHGLYEILLKVALNIYIPTFYYSQTTGTTTLPHQLG